MAVSFRKQVNRILGTTRPKDHIAYEFVIYVIDGISDSGADDNWSAKDAIDAYSKNFSWESGYQVSDAMMFKADVYKAIDRFLEHYKSLPDEGEDY